MLKFLFCILLASGPFILVEGMGGMIDYGCWHVLQIEKCPDMELPIEFEVEKRKANRTHDCYNSVWKLERVIDDMCGVQIKVFMKVDGGFKEYQNFADNSIAKFCEKMAEENLKQVLTMANIDPPSFPLEPGQYTIEGFELDKCEFPCKSVHGEFDAWCNLLDEDGKILACLKVTVEFKECDESEMCDKCQEE